MRYFQRQPLKITIQDELFAKTSKNWKKLAEHQRIDIVDKLIASQKHICAYCECRILSIENYHHIDHFEERHDALLRIFDYTNMLLSCEGNKDPISKPEVEEAAIYRKTNVSCGHKKEKGRHGDIEIDYDLLLNPTNNVSGLFSYQNGVVEPSKICTPTEQEQVKYTIKRLNLDAKRLEKSRIDEIDLINMDLIPLTEDEQKIHIRNLLDESKTQLNPYFSTIKDNFGFMLL
jgi:uncharacterized protein (TIGR02646 family)